MQDFVEGGVPTPDGVGGRILIFHNNLAENYMKMKEIEWPWVVCFLHPFQRQWLKLFLVLNSIDLHFDIFLAEVCIIL